MVRPSPRGHARTRPPSSASGSTRTTPTPRSARPVAAAMPAMPPPTTTTGAPVPSARTRPPSAGCRTARRSVPGCQPAAGPVLRRALTRASAGRAGLAGPERVQDAVLPARHRTDLDVDEPRRPEPVGEPLHGVERLDAAPQVAVQPGLA